MMTQMRKIPAWGQNSPPWAGMLASIWATGYSTTMVQFLALQLVWHSYHQRSSASFFSATQTSFRMLAKLYNTTFLTIFSRSLCIRERIGTSVCSTNIKNGSSESRENHAILTRTELHPSFQHLWEWKPIRVDSPTWFTALWLLKSVKGLRVFILSAVGRSFL
jgi:hypothetical protein